MLSINMMIFIGTINAVTVFGFSTNSIQTYIFNALCERLPDLTLISKLNKSCMHVGICDEKKILISEPKHNTMDYQTILTFRLLWWTEWSFGWHAAHISCCIRNTCIPVPVYIYTNLQCF